MASNDFTMSLTQNFNGVIQALEGEQEARLLAASMEWHKGVVKLLRGNKSGRVYPVPGTNRTYRASKPGESPATRLGDLRTSYRFLVQNNEGLVGSPLHYAYKLEKGTRKMAPRPHLKKAFVLNRQSIVDKMEGDWL